MECRMGNAIHKVVVFGANGVQGGAIARGLREGGFAVRAAVRTLRAGSLPGMEIVTADLDDPGSLRLACAGVDAAVLTVPLESNRVRFYAWAHEAILAAIESRVRMLVVNLSSRVPPGPIGVPAFDVRREVETLALRAPIPSVVVLRPAPYMDNLALPWATGRLRDGMLTYPMRDGFHAAWLATADLGPLVAAALRRPQLAGRAIDVGGPEALDGGGLASAFSAALGRPVRYLATPLDTFEQGLAPVLGAEVARGITAGYRWLSSQSDPLLLARNGNLALGELDRPLTRVVDWAEGFLARAAVGQRTGSPTTGGSR
jgi:uncharacterized protein YbjT (DUF2867 family)